MNLKYPYQNPGAEDSRGLNKKMCEELQIQEDHDTDGTFISISKMKQFMVGDVFQCDNGKVSMLKSRSSTNCPLCK